MSEKDSSVNDLTQFFKKSHKIEDNLYLGELKLATNKTELKTLDIKVIVSVVDYNMPEVKIPDIKYYHFRVADGPNEDILSIFGETNQIISDCQSKGVNVLVHCTAGVSRSATVVIAYLMSKHKKPYKEIIQRVKDIRKKISPNDGFVKQLILYEELNYRIDANDKKLRQHLLRTLFLNTNISNTSDRYFQRLVAVERLTPNLLPGKGYLCAK
ncbi:unnamed protein product, partial [Oppiella nova]